MDSLRQWIAGLPQHEELAPIYRDYRSTWLELAALRDQSGDRAVANVIGKSHCGEPLWAMTVTPSEPTSARPVFIVAGLHAMEHIGIAVAVELVRRAVSVDSPWSRPLVVMPMANPDGFLEVERGRREGRSKFWRKNARGVDLNRNFPELWNGDSFWAKRFPHYFAAGQGPVSEPEVLAVTTLFEKIRPAVAVSLHAFGNRIFFPYAGKKARLPDFDRYKEIGDAMSQCQPTKSYKVNQLSREIPFFTARGAELDYFHSRGALSFLLEIGSGPNMRAPRTWFSPFCWFNPERESFEQQVENVVPAVEYLAAL